MIPGPGGTAWLPMSRSIPYAVPPGLGILIYASTQHFMAKTRHFMLGFHIRRLRRGGAFGMSTSISCGAFI
ncbi:MAG: hypothetical protein DMG62_18435 [Acidobacteria bacterium]|nr:MAG: hypothetical protein DMG62_18435 [Acidobacteriota bacterium]